MGLLFVMPSICDCEYEPVVRNMHTLLICDQICKRGLILTSNFATFKRHMVKIMHQNLLWHKFNNVKYSLITVGVNIFVTSITKS